MDEQPLRTLDDAADWPEHAAFSQFLLVGYDGLIHAYNAPFRLSAGPSLELDAVGSNIFDLLRSIRITLETAFEQARSGSTSRFEFSKTSDRVERFYQARVFRLHDSVMLVISNTTTHRPSEGRLAATTRLLEESAATLSQMEAIAHLGSWDNHLVTGRYIWSDEFYRLLGLEPGVVEPTQELWRTFAHLDDDDVVFAAMEQAKVTHTPYNVDRRIVRADGTIRWVQQQAEYVYDDSGKALRIVGTSFDITARKEAEERLGYLAHHDSLTGLMNRVLLVQQIAQHIKRAKVEDSGLAVFFIDLDRFKNINDTHGHRTGDQFLCAVAERLREVAGESDSVARIGGDEFVVASMFADEQQANDFAQRLQRSFTDIFRVGDTGLLSNASIGVSFHPRDGDEADDLLNRADAAMYWVKTHGGNRSEFFAPNMRTEILERLAIEQELRGAVERGELLVYYQPILNAKREMIAVEALVRWIHPVRGLVEPGRFIGIAEETGLIVPIGEFVLQAACTQVAAWRAGAFPNLQLAVNVSGRQLQHEHLVDMVVRTLAATGLEAEALEIEITESVIMTNADANVGTLERLKALGINISIDDFGTGYSSLSYLKWFPLNTLKIDQSFVRDVPANRDAAAIITSIVNLAHNLHLRVVAEGVETQEQLEFLIAADCDNVQGYFFGRPMPAGDFSRTFIQLRH